MASHESESQAPELDIFKCIADDISSGSFSGPEIYPSPAALVDSCLRFLISKLRKGLKNIFPLEM